MTLSRQRGQSFSLTNPVAGRGYRGELLKIWQNQASSSQLERTRVPPRQVEKCENASGLEWKSALSGVFLRSAQPRLGCYSRVWKLGRIAAAFASNTFIRAGIPR